ncbi:hypothetical protein PR202_ga31542 [Eleusine coracana subsp. coracana]|uniref:non-specific serine/threonine protein kinase n=1 Tax=Eleusine coracana subsp. coracana TaxID=191504 RepID=A0AAV5DQH4_ELECO|nr:hypothetical protein PR202_ga31542 [Eleusine coracana subsp. coracana]
MTAPRRSSLACLGLLLLLLLFSARGADAGQVAIDLVRPNFTASAFEYIDSGGSFLESGNGAFKAAVFNPGKQQASFYLAVLHEPTGTVVWSANRAAPTTSSGRVRLTPQGLAVSDPDGTVLWSTPPQLRSPVAALRLLDSGNLQLLDAGNATLWQSFDNATDTLLPGQRLLAGAYLSAARSAVDLSEGEYRLAVTAADVALTWQGATYWRLSNDVRAYKDRNAPVAAVSVNASGLFALAADGALVFRAALADEANFRVLNLGSDGRLRITSYAEVNSSDPVGGGDFVAPAEDCDLPTQCPSLGLCSSAGNGSSCTCPPLFAASASTPGACTPGDGSTLASRTNSCHGSSNDSSSAPGVVSYLGLRLRTAYFATRFDPPTITGVNDTACRGLCTASCTCLAYFHDNSSNSCYLIQEKQLGSLYWESSATSALGYIKTVQSPQNSTRSRDGSSSTNRAVPIVLPSIAVFLVIAVVALYACWKRKNKSNKKSSKNTGVNKQSHKSGHHNNAAISDRADVYSFGMVLLELVHGRKNRGGEEGNHVAAVVGSGGEQSSDGWSSAAPSTLSATSDGGDEYFPMVALDLHEQGRYLDLVDPRLEGRVDEAEAARAVRVALCCLHEDPALRPRMSAVVRMLEGSVPAPEPRVEALGFLRLYGRGYAAPASTTAMAGTSGSTATPSTPGASSQSQLNDSSQDVSLPR